MLLIFLFFVQFVGVEGLITGIMDMLPPKSALSNIRREVVAAICCIICFLIDMSMVTEVKNEDAFLFCLKKAAANLMKIIFLCKMFTF